MLENNSNEKKDQETKVPDKVVIKNKKDPNYVEIFVTDAMLTPSSLPEYLRISFYEEYQPNPDFEILDVDNTGKLIQEGAKSYFSHPHPTKDELNDLKIAHVTRNIKATLVMNRDSAKRLKDWLEQQDL